VNDHATERALAKDLRTRVNRSLGEAAADAIDRLCDEADSANKCLTCGGDPNSHVSKLPCVCEDGTRSGEIMGLRIAVFDADAAGLLANDKNAALRAKLATAKAGMGTAQSALLYAHRGEPGLAMAKALSILDATLETIKEVDNAK
jgi:hypothetical protein